MTLKNLINILPDSTVTGESASPITGITSDSRKVVSGSIFVCISGEEHDGADYIQSALKQGAVAIVSEKVVANSWDESVSYIQVSDARAALAALACAWNAHPSAKMKVIGITGTNGKTTTSYIAHAIMNDVWRRAGLLGTVVVDDGEEKHEATHTTPGAVELQSTLATMLGNDCRGVAMEISSHAIEQKRVDGLELDVAVFTNLSQDHLDYHGSMNKYFRAKCRLFEMLGNQSGNKKTTAVINLDDDYGQKLKEEFDGELYFLTYGHGVHADVRIGRTIQNVRGTEFELTYKEKQYRVSTPYIGRFNVSNCVAALSACIAVGINARDCIKALANVPQVPGRMENIGSRDGASLFVDYAHTPDAVEKACAALKELNPRRLITVFGCGGDRDETKRPLMGQAAAKGSDICIVTTDNPRSEDPALIVKHIEKGMSGAQYEVILNRDEAIQAAVNISGEGDIILVAGKGHETYQEVKGERLPFDDRRSAYKALNLKKAPTPGE